MSQRQATSHQEVASPLPWSIVDWHELPHIDSARCIVSRRGKKDEKIIAMVPWDCSHCRGVRKDHSMFADLAQRGPNANIFAAAGLLLENAKLLGGGETYFEAFGRYCYCGRCQIRDSGPVDYGNHSTSCDDMNKAIALADGRTD